MNTEKGKVIDVKNGTAYVVLESGTSCAQCGGCVGHSRPKDIVVRVPLAPEHPETEYQDRKYSSAEHGDVTYTGARDGDTDYRGTPERRIRPGDLVRLEGESGGPAAMGFLYLLLPIVLALTGYFLGSSLGEKTGIANQQLSGAVFAVGLFIAPYLLFYIIRKYRERRGKQWVKIVKQTAEEEKVNEENPTTTREKSIKTVTDGLETGTPPEFSAGGRSGRSGGAV